jgi:hypothetical protein
MKRTAALLAVLAATVALAAGLTLQTGTRFEFTDCSSGGSAAQTVTRGEYLLRVTDADVWVCYAATCATGGEKLPSGFSALFSFGGSQSVSCRSSASTGDLILTLTNSVP